MPTVRALLLGLLTTLHFAAAAATVDVSSFVGTWRVARDTTVVHIRIEPDGRVEFAHPADGSSIKGKALLGGENGLVAFSGMLSNGQAFAIGMIRGKPMLSLGEATLPMQAVTAHQPQPAMPAGHAGQSLAGLRLSMAKGRNGYFTERSYDFCADGRVYTRWAESQMSQFGSGVSERTDQGTWRLSGDALQLDLARGGASTLAVRQTEAQVIRLGTTAYAVARSSRCR
jgi:hypothetical protein